LAACKGSSVRVKVARLLGRRSEAGVYVGPSCSTCALGDPSGCRRPFAGRPLPATYGAKLLIRVRRSPSARCGSGRVTPGRVADGCRTSRRSATIPVAPWLPRARGSAGAVHAARSRSSSPRTKRRRRRTRPRGAREERKPAEEACAPRRMKWEVDATVATISTPRVERRPDILGPPRRRRRDGELEERKRRQARRRRTRKGIKSADIPPGRGC